MQTKPIFIGIAAGILMLVVAAASFAGGLYTGRRAFAADARAQIRQGGPGQGQGMNGPQTGRQQFGGGPQQGGQNGPRTGQPSPNRFGADGPAGAPSWPPDSIGHITEISDTQFTYENREGKIATISFDATTKFIDADGAEIAIADLQVGDVIAVFGADVATTIMQMPPKPSGLPAAEPTAQPAP